MSEQDYQGEIVQDEELFIYRPRPRKVVAAGIYTATVTRVDIVKKKEEWIQSEFDDPYQLKITFTFTDASGEPVHLMGYTARVLGINGKGAKYKTLLWAEAILDRKIPRDEWDGFDFRALAGHECRINVEDEKSDGSPGNKIVSVKPAAGPSGPTPKGSKDKSLQARKDAAWLARRQDGWDEGALADEVHKYFPGKFAALPPEEQLAACEFLESLGKPKTANELEF